MSNWHIYDDYDDYLDDACLEPEYYFEPDEDGVVRFSAISKEHVQAYDDPHHTEIWLDNPRWNGYVFKNHQVSSHGRVRNRKRLNILKPLLDKDGYERLSIGNVDNVPVAILVCDRFAGPAPRKGMQVNHIDTNRTNNHCLNLEWTTPAENVSWGVYKGNVDWQKGLDAAVSVNKRPVRIVELDMEFESAKECAKYLGVVPTNVSRCLRGARKGQRLHNYHLEYVERSNEDDE
jgi:hypothetical protein